MTDHHQASAFYDEDWNVHCSCGACFYARLRPDAEEALRKHIAEEGIAEARAALNKGEE